MSAQPVANPSRGRSRGALLAIPVILLLLVVAALQGVMLLRLDKQVDDMRAENQETRITANSRIGGLEKRVKQLEQAAGRTLDAASVAAAVTPSVFKVVAKSGTGTAFAFGTAPSEGGTYLVTNFHVVEDSYRSSNKVVTLEQQSHSYSATIARVDEGSDLALLLCAETFPRLSAEHSEAVPGEPILVVGAPLGAENTITTGVVSALRDTSLGQMVQFDAAINPGNSGGPVVNAQKYVVGVATAKILEADGIGLAIPVSVVCDSFRNC